MLLKDIIDKIEKYNYRFIHIHHSGGATTDDMGGPMEQAKIIKHFHIDGKGWSDIGYHLILHPNGTWIVGRDLERKPASIRGQNSGALAVLILGNFESDILEGEQLEEIQKFTSEMMKLGYEKDQFKFHRDLAPTKCPGKNIEKDMIFKNGKTDFEGHWAEKYIQDLMNSGIVNESKKFRPDDKITRAEMAAIIFRILNFKN